MVDYEDDDLFEGLLESDSEPQSDFDVASVLRRVKKLEYKLEKQKAYKKDVELKLKLGVEKTEDAIDTLKDMILTYMKSNKKSKLSFDDVGTVSVVNADKEDWLFPDDKEADAKIIELLNELDIGDCFKEQDPKIDKKRLKEVLETNDHIAEEFKGLIPWGKVGAHLSFRKK